MTTLPEEAVKAAQSELSRIISEWERNREFLNVTPEANKNFMRRQASALTALEPSASANQLSGISGQLIESLIKDADWLGEYGIQMHEESEYHDGGYTANRLQAIGDRISKLIEAGITATEPSAARELALEEAAKIAFDISENGEYHGEASVDSTSSIYQQGAYEVYEALRSLSSPDHADAGKVEGDVEKWSIREIVAKAIAYHSVGDPHAKTIRGDQRWEWFVEEADKFISVFGYYLPAIPSAPASEGAE